MSEEKTSEVERRLRGQREDWREITERVSKISSFELSPETPKRFIFFGLGSSYIAAQLSAFAIMRDKTRARIPVFAYPSTHLGVKLFPQKGDWVFAFTHRGSPGATRAAMDLSSRLGAFVIQISAQGVEQAPTANVMIPTVEMEKVEPHTAAVTGAICAVTSLLLGNKGVEEWDAIRSIGDPDLGLMRSRSGQGPSVILGEFEGEWIARECALKLAEMARLPARVYATEEYFHGPKWAQTEGDRIWHVSLPQDPRNQEVKADHVLFVGGASPLAWMPALVEAQWLSLAVALNRGVDPDLNPRH